MVHGFTYHRRVEFVDTDTAGVVHFTSLFRYVEEAEHAFYRSLGGAAFHRGDDEVLGMPRLAASLEFERPVRYGDEVEVELTVREKTDKALGYEVVIRQASGGAGSTPGPVVARGTMKVIQVRARHGAPMWNATSIPPELARQIEVAPEA